MYIYVKKPVENLIPNKLVQGVLQDNSTAVQLFICHILLIFHKIFSISFSNQSAVFNILYEYQQSRQDFTGTYHPW